MKSDFISAQVEIKADSEDMGAALSNAMNQFSTLKPLEETGS